MLHKACGTKHAGPKLVCGIYFVVVKNWQKFSKKVFDKTRSKSIISVKMACAELARIAQYGDDYEECDIVPTETITGSSSKTVSCILNNGVVLEIIAVDELFKRVRFGKVNVKPTIQRALPAWTLVISNILRKSMLDAVFQNKQLFIPSIVYYRYHQGQLLPSQSWETMCLDGGNRTRSICDFIDGKYTSSGSTEDAIPPCCVMDINGTETSVFFADSYIASDYKQKTKKHVYILTQAQQQAFLGIQLITSTYTSYMSEEELGQRFLELQNCVKVTGSDISKLKFSCPFVEFVSKQKSIQYGIWQDWMLCVLDKRIYNKVGKYWMPWITKCYLILNPKPNKTHADMLSLADKTIDEYINDNSDLLQLNEEKFEDFKHKFEVFLEFLCGDSMKSTHKISLPAFFAIFYVLATSQEVTVETLTSNISVFVNHKDTNKRLWDKRKIPNGGVGAKYTMDDVRSEYEYLVDVLRNYKFVRSRDHNKRMPIPKQTRLTIEQRIFGNATEQQCPCCDTNMIYKDRANGYHMGHIVAHALGGTSTIDNLIPICSTCNLNMDIEDLFHYQERCYPNAPSARELMASF